MTAEAASRTFTCSEYGWAASKWMGCCPQCQAWGILEEGGAPRTRTSTLAPTNSAMPITEVPTMASVKQPTGIDEFDHVLEGGLIPGAVVLPTGEPGVGKSTLLLGVAAHTAEAATRSGRAPVLYISGEESAFQVRLHAKRIGALHDHLHLAAESDLAAVLGYVDSVRPSLLVVDSMQTAVDSQIEGATGGVTRVRGVTSALVADARTRSMPVLFVGRVMKGGSIAGPRVLGHLVDVVCQFEGDRHPPPRMIHAVKDRCGPTEEADCFELNEAGIHGLAGPSRLLLSSRHENVPGTYVTMALKGRRPMPVEVQALIVPSSGPSGWATSGLGSSRTTMAIAVLQSRLDLDLDRCGVFLSTVDDARSAEPATDAAIVLALVSARLDRPLTAGAAAIGEVSLIGELRPVTGIQQHPTEAHRPGFGIAIIPRKTCEANVRVSGGLALLECDDTLEAAAREDLA